MKATIRIGSLEISGSLLAINPHLRGAAKTAPSYTRSRALCVADGVACAADSLVVEIPGLKLVLTANSRVHWAKRGATVRRQRAVVSTVLAAHRPPRPPCTVILTRVGPRALDDDNATASCKAVRDAVARWLGVDDGDERVTWRVAQERGAYAVRIEVRQ